MLALSQRTPQEKRAKTRSGCKACKVRRIKCDETLPSCLQCNRRKAQCPGYTPKLKWSNKYEKLHNQDRNPANQNKSIASEASIQVDFGSCYPSPPFIEEQDAVWIPSEDTASEAHDDSWEEVNPNSTPALDRIGAPSKSYLEMDIIPCGSSDVSLSLDDLSTFGIWELGPTGDAMLYSSAIELHYFSHTICACLFACDSPSNPVRLVTVSKARSSHLYQSLLKYIVTAYLCNNDPVYSTQSLLRDARADIISSLQNGLRMLIHGGVSRALFEDTLLAMIMYGLSTSWDGSNDTGARHYEGAITLYSRGKQSMSSSTKYFISESLVYWWAGLCFVTDTGAEPLSPPPSIMTLGEEEVPRSPITKYGPHPLTGISPQVHILLGKVGSIVHAQRIRALRASFTSRDSIRQEQEALQCAQCLEGELLALQIPSVDITDSDAYSTPITDLRNMAEAYQLCALLLLYKGFPDLLHERMGVLKEGSCSAQLWLGSLALHILEVLSRNGSNSSTRSVEQILLVIIAGELRMPEDQLRDDFWLTGLNQPFPTNNDPSRTLTVENISQARNTLMQRLASVRSILPYRSLHQVEELIVETWRKNDAGEKVFWMDIMIQNGWKFVMA